jgi:hypothetical protein
MKEKCSAYLLPFRPRKAGKFLLGPYQNDYINDNYYGTITITVDFRQGLNKLIILIIIAITISENGEF